MAEMVERVNVLRDMDDDAVSRAYAKQMMRFRSGYNKSARAVHSAAPGASKILDAAIGPAIAVPQLASLYPDATIFGVDISAHMLARARETLVAAGIDDRVELVQGSVYEMPFEDDFFDLVIASQLIHMLDDLPACLREVRRVLSPGGTLMIADFRRDVPGWYRGVANLSTSILRTLHVPMDGMGPVIKASYTPTELEHGLRAAGFGEVVVTAGIAELTVVAR